MKSFDNKEKKVKENKFENYLEGKNAIFESYKSGRGIKKLFILKGIKDEKVNVLINEVKSIGTIINYLSREELDKMSETKSHQGIIAEVEEYKYVEVDEILDFAKKKNEDPLIVILDEVTDPHNFGAIIRSAECVGAHGIIVKNRDQSPISSIVVSASAGAIAHIKIARVTNLNKTIDDLKEKGLWFACASMEGETYTKANLKGPLGLVVGSEGRGVSRLLKEKCDFVVSIPLYGKVDSLNVSVATGILLYEIRRQRSIK